MPLASSKSFLIRNRTLKFVFSRPINNPRTQWLIRTYSEICATLGVRFEFIDVPARRATLMVVSGEVSGELGRTLEYKNLYPRLIRVNEPNNLVRFCAYGIATTTAFKDMKNVREKGLRCETRRGIPELEVFLKNNLAQSNFSEIGEVWQGVKKLQLNRTDLYFDVEEAVDDYLRSQECVKSFAEQPLIRNLGTILTTTGHCYLNPAHADIAPQISDALGIMKRQGLVNRYLSEALEKHRKSCF